jgi:hypothetical protein
MTVRADHHEIVRRVVLSVPVDMVKLQNLRPLDEVAIHTTDATDNLPKTLAQPITVMALGEFFIEQYQPFMATLIVNAIKLRRLRSDG